VTKKILVEEDLTPIRKYLENKGFDVETINDNSDLKEKDLKNLQAIVISGHDMNMLGMHDIKTKAIVVNAEGRTPEEVYEEIKRRS